jgi:hypothetical protein
MLLRSPGYDEAPLYIGTLTLFYGSTYIWNVRVVLYEKATTDCICHTHQVHEAATPRAKFEADIWDAACQTFAIFCHEEDDPMEHTQYHHFLSRPHGGSNIVVLPARLNDPVGCLHDQVHLTCTMNEELDQAMFEICCLYEQEREAKRKIVDLEALCNRQEDQINMDLEEGFKVCDGLIEELVEQQGLEMRMTML